MFRLNCSEELPFLQKRLVAVPHSFPLYLFIKTVARKSAYRLQCEALYKKNIGTLQNNIYGHEGLHIGNYLSFLTFVKLIFSLFFLISV